MLVVDEVIKCVCEQVIVNFVDGVDYEVFEFSFDVLFMVGFWCSNEVVVVVDVFFCMVEICLLVYLDEYGEQLVVLFKYCNGYRLMIKVIDLFNVLCYLEMLIVVDSLLWVLMYEEGLVCKVVFLDLGVLVKYNILVYFGDGVVRGIGLVF